MATGKEWSKEEQALALSGAMQVMLYDPAPFSAADKNVRATLEQVKEWIASGVPLPPAGAAWVTMPGVSVSGFTISADATGVATFQGVEKTFPAFSYTATAPGEGLLRLVILYAKPDGTYAASVGDAAQNPVQPTYPATALFVSMMVVTPTGGIIQQPTSYVTSITEREDGVDSQPMTGAVVLNKGDKRYKALGTGAVTVNYATSPNWKGTAAGVASITAANIPDGGDLRIELLDCAGETIPIGGSGNVDHAGAGITELTLPAEGDCYILINNTGSSLKWSVTGTGGESLTVQPNRILGRYSAAAGAPQELQTGTNLSISDAGLINAFTGMEGFDPSRTYYTGDLFRDGDILYEAVVAWEKETYASFEAIPKENMRFVSNLDGPLLMHASSNSTDATLSIGFQDGVYNQLFTTSPDAPAGQTLTWVVNGQIPKHSRKQIRFAWNGITDIAHFGESVSGDTSMPTGAVAGDVLVLDLYAYEDGTLTLMRKYLQGKDTTGGTGTGGVTSWQTITGDGTATAFTLTGESPAVIAVFGPYGRKESSYTVSGSTITFTTAPATGDVYEVLKGTLGDVQQTEGAGDNRLNMFAYAGSNSFTLPATITEAITVDVIGSTRSIFHAKVTISGTTLTISATSDAGGDQTLLTGDTIRIWWR